MSWSEKYELREKKRSVASRHLCSFGGGGSTGVFADNHCKRESIKESSRMPLVVPEENSAGKNPKIFLDTCDETSLKTRLN